MDARQRNELIECYARRLFKAVYPGRDWAKVESPSAELYLCQAEKSLVSRGVIPPAPAAKQAS